MQKTPVLLRTLTRRCYVLCSPLCTLLHKQKVLSCMKLWEHLFFFWLFFSLWGLGRGAQLSDAVFADVVLKSSHKHATRRYLFIYFLFLRVCGTKFRSLLLLHLPWKVFSPPANSEFAEWIFASSFINPSGSSIQHRAGQRNPGGVWPVTPVNPAPT